MRDFGSYEEVNDLGQCAVSTTWVMSYKGSETRARLLARGFGEDSDIQRDSPTVSKSALQIFLAIAASKELSVKITDIKSAFLQGKSLEWDVFLQPHAKVGVPSTKIWKVKRCLYGLNDAARQFYQSVVEALAKLKCDQAKQDPALFHYRQEGKDFGYGSQPNWWLSSCGESISFWQWCDAAMGSAVRVRSAGQKYGPTCHQGDGADVTEFVTLVRLSSLEQHVGVLALAGYKHPKSALAAGPIASEVSGLQTFKRKRLSSTLVFTSSD